MVHYVGSCLRRARSIVTHHSRISQHQHTRTTQVRFEIFKENKRLALSQIVRDAGSKSSIVRRNLEAKLVRTDQMRRVISLNTHINGKRRTIDFIVTSNGSETVDEANARWELWLKASDPCQVITNPRTRMTRTIET